MEAFQLGARPYLEKNMDIRSMSTVLQYLGAGILPTSRSRRPIRSRYSRPCNETPDCQAAQRRRRQIARGMLKLPLPHLYQNKPPKQDPGRQVRPHRSGGGYRHETWSDL
jgi:hypothetical protein